MLNIFFACVQEAHAYALVVVGRSFVNPATTTTTMAPCCKSDRDQTQVIDVGTSDYDLGSDQLRKSVILADTSEGSLWLTLPTCASLSHCGKDTPTYDFTVTNAKGQGKLYIKLAEHASIHLHYSVVTDSQGKIALEAGESRRFLITVKRDEHHLCGCGGPKSRCTLVQASSGKTLPGVTADCL